MDNKQLQTQVFPTDIVEHQKEKEAKDESTHIKPDEITNSNVARLLRAVMGFNDPRPVLFGRL